jgi:hypothetical protein
MVMVMVVVMVMVMVMVMMHDDGRDVDDDDVMQPTIPCSSNLKTSGILISSLTSKGSPRKHDNKYLNFFYEGKTTSRIYDIKLDFMSLTYAHLG